MTDTAGQLLEREGGAMVRRLFAKDPTLWGGDAQTPELADRMGWLDAPQRYAREVVALEVLRDAVRSAKFSRVVLLGMGGSSLAPDVFTRIFGAQPGHPSLTVLDTTHPDAVLAALDGGALERTLFLVSSKSGGTLETSSLFKFFWQKTGGNGAQFIAITDPGTSLAALGRSRGFRAVFENDAEIGGRFSALSYFGLVPAALLGIQLTDVMDRAREAAMRSAEAAARGDAGGVSGAALGAHLGAGWRAGRDKLTLCASPGWGGFGVWVEQLVAESTGKGGVGIVPVVQEPDYGRTPSSDRTWVAMIERGTALDLPPGAAAYTAHGLQSADIGAQFYAWEVATALAGAWMGINPYDQPNVGESKTNSERALKDAASPPPDVTGTEGLPAALGAWLAALEPGDYAAVLAYVPPTPAHELLLQRMRRAIGRARGVATTAGYGPRFLHSTGQLHKGGPASGAFLQIETEPSRDADVPEAGYSFGRLIRAQAVGDQGSLAAHGRRVLRVRVGAGELEAVAAELEAGS